ncbi:putative cyclin domain-containing protein [Helianthus annuus]|nr:putative cyclin domain-containing protein [Helianthus annuus]
MIQRGIQSILNSLHISRSLSHLHQNPNFISKPATSMDTDENCVDVINRPSRKHIATVHDVSHNVFKQTCSTKKRVALAEITNSGSVCSIPSSDSRRNVKQKKDQECVRSDLSVSFESARDDRPLMYQHLHLIEIEEKRRPLPNYMKKIQKDVTAGMREILVDWLVEVAEEYKLVSDTLFLTVSYIDRFLSSHCLSRNKLQLLGVSSMLLASKFEEVSPPHAEDYCYITDNTYTKEEPSNSAFEFLSWFLVELSLLDYSCLRFLPSMVAGLSRFYCKLYNSTGKASLGEKLANLLVLNKRFDSEKSRFIFYPFQGLKMQRYSGYRPCELKDCVIAIHDLQLRRTSSFSQATREKYSQQKFKCVAALLSPPVIPVSYFEDADE